MAQTQMTSIPIVTIIVCVVIGLCVLSGALRGFVRKISGLVAFILSIILVTALLPPITSWLHTTPVYGFIKDQCETIGGNLVKNTIADALSTSGTAAGSGDVSSVINSVRSDDGSGSLDRSKIKAQLQAMGYDPSIIDSMSDAELESYAQQLAGSFAGMIGPAFGLCICPAFAMSVNAPFLPYAGMDRVDQTKFIESLPLPQSIKDQMETFNNENGYLKLGATDFGSYIINYIASLIMNILAYVVTFFVVWLIIRLVLGALSVFRSLPIIGTADHLLGLVLGLIQGVLIVWGLFLILSLFATSEIGAGLMREINSSPFLSALYNMNPFLNSAAGAIKGIM